MDDPYTQHQLHKPISSKLIRCLIITIIVFGVLSGLFKSPLGQILPKSFMELFALSLGGLKSGFIWQFATFIFIPKIEGSISPYFLFTLIFDLYILRIIGGAIHALMGTKKTLILFVIPPIIASIISLFIGSFIHLNTPLYGLNFSIISLVIAYCVINPRAQFAFMPSHSIRAKWVGIGLATLYTFQDLANLDILSVITYGLVICISYVYIVVFEKISSSSRVLKPFESLFVKEKESGLKKIIPLYESIDTKAKKQASNMHLTKLIWRFKSFISRFKRG